MQKRRTKMPKAGLQLKLALTLLLCATACCTVQFLFFLRSTAEVAAAGPASREAMLSQLNAVVIKQYLTTLVLLVPLMVSVGIVISYPMVGPIYRFEKYFRDIVATGEVTPCRIRQNDDLQYLCTLINQAMERITGDAATRGGAVQAAAPESAVPVKDQTVLT